MKRKNDKWIRIAGYLSGEMDGKRHQEFLAELAQDESLKHEVETMKQTWKKFNENPSARYNDTREAWKKLEQRIQDEGMMEEERTAPIVPLRYRIYRIAAMLALLIAVGVPTIYYLFDRNSGPGSGIEHTASSGVLTVDLPDGSRVFLNEGANLKYEKSFLNNRNVELKGEGYFDVMSDPAKPFRVNAGKVVVTVLGTSFNVKEKPEQNDVEVFVEKGTVKVAMDHNNQSLTLKPGDLGIAGTTLESGIQSDDNYLSWKTREFKFVDKPVSDIIEVLGNAYHVTVNDDQVDLSGMRLTTTYSEQSFDAILSTICLALGLEYEKEGKVYILQENNR